MPQRRFPLKLPAPTGRGSTGTSVKRSAAVVLLLGARYRMQQIVQVVGVVVMMRRGGGQTKERAASSAHPRIHRSIQSPSRSLCPSRERNQRAPRWARLHDNTIPQRCLFCSLFGNLDYSVGLLRTPDQPSNPPLPPGRSLTLALLAGPGPKKRERGREVQGGKVPCSMLCKTLVTFTVVTVPRTYIHTYIHTVLTLYSSVAPH